MGDGADCAMLGQQLAARGSGGLWGLDYCSLRRERKDFAYRC